MAGMKGTESLRPVLGLIGVCLIGLGIGWYFRGPVAGACLFLCLAGTGLVLDALRK